MCSPRPSLTALLLIAGACHINNPVVGAVAEPTKSGGQGAISGKIIDAKAAPIAKAQVTLYRLESPTGRWGRFKIARESAATDQAGSFKFQGLEDGYFMLSVEGAGFARAFRAANIQAHSSQQIDVALRPPASFVIHVEDQDGKPVDGAHVRDITVRGAIGELPSLGSSGCVRSAFRLHPAT